MSYKYVLDSSAWIEYIGGTEKGFKIKDIIEQEPIATSIIAIAELGDKFAREDRQFDMSLRFIQSKAALLPITVEIAVNAGKLKKELRCKNPKFSLADALHLATAKNEKAVLITTDTDFMGVKNVMIL